MSATRRLTPIDRFLSEFEHALRTSLASSAHSAQRPNPAAGTQESGLTEAERIEAGRLMRVNHAGEVAAQALYHAQALFARDPDVREFMLHAAREETDHLAWCEARLKELGARPSVLNPLWYAGSFGIGAVAALLGDKASLGFVAETERQVEGHLKSHLERLPPEDQRSRAIVEAMCHDEVGHGRQAESAGAANLPGPIRELMRRTARVMTHTAYRL